MYTTGDYLKHNPTWHEEDAPWKARQIAQNMSDNAIEPNSMCEVGCGTGQILLELSEKFAPTKLVGC